MSASRSLPTGGAAPRVSPFPDLRDCAGLLQRAGYAMPVADVETIRLRYATPLRLLDDLRSAGETNAVRLRDRRIPPRDLFPAALAMLQQELATLQDDQGRALPGGGETPGITATLRMAVMTGWQSCPSPPLLFQHRQIVFHDLLLGEALNARREARFGGIVRHAIGGHEAPAEPVSR